MQTRDIHEFTLLVNSRLDKLSKEQDLVLSKIYILLRKLASVQLARAPGHNTVTPTVLVNEIFVKLIEDELLWNDRQHFIATVSVSIRHLLVDLARKKRAHKRGGNEHITSLADKDLVDCRNVEAICAADELVERIVQENPEAARIVELKFFLGLSNEEVSKALGCTRQTVHRRWEIAKQQLLESLT